MFIKALAQGPLLNEPIAVECDLTTCNIEKFLQLANNVINTFIEIGIILSVFILIYIAISLIFNYKVSATKGIFKVWLVAIILLLGSYLLVEFLFSSLGYEGNPFEVKQNTTSESGP